MIILMFLVSAIMLLGPFWVLARKGAKYARNGTHIVFTFLGGLMWYGLMSWGVIFGGGHGFLLLPLPSFIGVPLSFACADCMNYPFTIFSKYGNIIPIIHFFVFYASYFWVRTRNLYKPAENA